MNAREEQQDSQKPTADLYYSEVLRAGVELSMLCSPPIRSALESAPRGKRHPVVVIPGFTASDRSTKVLRTYLNQLGYSAYGWRQKTNLGVRPHKMEGLVRHIAALAERTDQKVSLVGQSLGGIFSREIAKEFPQVIEQVICLGSPFSDMHGTSSRVSDLYEYYNAEHLTKTEQFERAHWQLPEAPDVPMSAVYSPWDGVCHWKACMQEDGHPQCENIAVYGSHTGMAVNASVMYAVADRLAQVGNDWEPFRPPARLAWMYPPFGSIN